MDSKGTVYQLRSYLMNRLFFHLSFLSLLWGLGLVALALFPSFFLSLYPAIALSAFFLAGFAYLLLALYEKEKGKAFAVQLSSDVEDPKLLFDYLGDWEIPLSGWLSPFRSLLERRFIDRHLTYFRRLLMEQVIEERLEKMRLAPFEAAHHEALADHLTSLYHLTQGKEFLLRAIEELKIVLALGGNRYEELAGLYLLLGEEGEELKVREEFLEKGGNTPQNLYRMGVLYFQTGQVMKGLFLYKKLLPLDGAKGEALLTFYQPARCPV